MEKRKSKIIIISVVAILFVALSVLFIFSDTDSVFAKLGLRDRILPEKGIMYVNCIDVGQGSSTLITCGKTAILVDGGEEPYSSKVISYLKNQNISRLDCVIATHPHTDHIGSLYAVLDEFEIGAVIMPNLSADSIPKDDYYKKFINSVKTNAEKEIYTNGGKEYAFGEINIDVFSPLKTYEDMNSCSIAARISYNNTSVMVTGDIQSDAEADIIKNFGNIKSDILCVSHHGSKTTTSESWLDAVNPDYAVVSCGVNNDYGHPHINLLKRLESHKINYYRTDLSGDILFRCDGKNVVYLGDNYYGMDRTK